MPEMQPPVPAPSAAIPVLIEAPPSLREDTDYALGCECADPALQIPCWGQEAGTDSP
jgi:hypothetical protein